MRGVTRGIAYFLLIVSATWTGTPAYPAENVLRAKYLEHPPRIDGILAPGEWEQATHLAPFWYLKEQREADFRTEAYIAYTSEGIYAAFDCEDPEPERIHAQEFRRNADLSRDDYVELAVEPSGLSDAEPYLFRVNPLGTQYDQLPGGSASNLRWRGDWKAAAARHERGWSVEIFIPFRMLRIPRGQNEFFLALARYVPRQSVTYHYPNTGTVYDALKRARWTGVKTPEILPPPIVLPYLQLDASDKGTEWRSGLDLKMGLRGGGTVLLTLNPDFKNIAGAVDSVAFSYVPRLIPETRPFFIEGDSFFPDTTLFYSGNLRRVDAGLKAFGALSRWSYGLLLSTGGGSRALVGRLGYQIAPRARTEVQIVHDIQPGLHATAIGTGIVAYPTLKEGHAVVGGLYFRTGSNGSSPVGEKMALSFWQYRGDGRISYGAHLQKVSHSFFPTLGYAPERGFRGYDVGATYEDRWTNRSLQQIQAGVHRAQRWRQEGGLLDETVDGWLNAIWRNDLTLWLNGILYRRPPYSDRTLAIGVYWNSRRLYNTGGILMSFGRVAGGDSLFWTFNQGIPFSSRARLNLRYERSRIAYGSPALPDRRQHLLVATFTYDLDAERSIGGQYIGRGARFSHFDQIDTLYLTYRQQVRRGADIFLIFGDPNASRTQTRFAFKVMTPW